MTSSNGNIFLVTGPLCGEFTGHRWIPRTQRPVTRSVGVFFDLRLNKRLSKQSRSWWFKTQSGSLWRHCNGLTKAVLKIGQGWVITSHCFMWTYLITQALIAMIYAVLVQQAPVAETVKRLPRSLWWFHVILQKLCNQPSDILVTIFRYIGVRANDIEAQSGYSYLEFIQIIKIFTAAFFTYKKTNKTPYYPLNPCQLRLATKTIFRSISICCNSYHPRDRMSKSGLA